MWLDNQDNDAIGFNFGWRAADDFFRVYKVNDVWNVDPSDYVGLFQCLIFGSSDLRIFGFSSDFFLLIFF